MVAIKAIRFEKPGGPAVLDYRQIELPPPAAGEVRVDVLTGQSQLALTTPADQNAAYRSLGAGQTKTVTVNYAVTDGIATTPASVVFTVTGVNDAPVVSGPVTGQFVNEGNSGSYDLPTLLSVALSWSPDPDSILSRIISTSPSGKALGMADPELDKMIVDARTILDVKKRAEAYMAIQKRINDQAYVLDIYQYPLRWEAWWSFAKGYVPLAANIRSFVRTAWIDK